FRLGPRRPHEGGPDLRRDQAQGRGAVGGAAQAQAGGAGRLRPEEGGGAPGVAEEDRRADGQARRVRAGLPEEEPVGGRAGVRRRRAGDAPRAGGPEGGADPVSPPVAMGGRSLWHGLPTVPQGPTAG